ncbi:MAG: DNA repair protein [Candidatus Electrothrix sp. AW3_4]|nr:DNA repair protein [Candidatus Electrothrix gigas]
MSNPVKIKKGLKLGELDAEADRSMLEVCFIDNGQLNNIIEVTSPRSIILGRTGSGKSAFLYKISSESEKSSVLDPNDISIRFLEHSNIIQFFNELGVKLDLFYKILWRHILIVDLLKLRYNLRNESECKTLWGQIQRWVQKDSVKRRALEYFSEWGDKFWLETDEQLKELTEKFTNDVKANFKGKYPNVDISLEGAKGLTEEMRTEIKSLATQVVSGIQIKRLNEVQKLLRDHAFNDRQKRYYILIDQLDEDWAETKTRCRFIRALIEETKSLRHIPQVKIITALRRDLLDLVFNETRDSGFQQEKYEAYLEVISWSREDLSLILDNRVTEIYRRQYTKDNVKFSHIFPDTRKKTSETSIGYIIDRTLMRPRDAIQFANECFSAASDCTNISWRSIYIAEANYSLKRLNSLSEEWYEFYPGLKSTIEILRGLPDTFTRSLITSDKISDISSDLSDYDIEGPCITVAKKLYENGTGVTEAKFVSEVLMCLYHVGAIGLKISKSDSFIWSYINQPRISQGEAKRANQIVVHKMLHQSLEIKLKKGKKGKKVKRR